MQMFGKNFFNKIQKNKIQKMFINRKIYPSENLKDNKFYM